MKNNLIFSIIIPAHNEEKYLSSCLQSLVNQDFDKDKYEVIVVNNGSTDKTVAIAKKFRVRVVNEPQKGLVRARNTGLKKAKGKYIINLDADCRVPQNWFLQIYSHFKKDKKTALVTGPCICLTSGKKHDYLNLFFAFVLHLWYKLFKTSPTYYGANVAIKKSSLVAIGGYDLRFPADQLSLIKRLKKTGGRILFDKDLKISSSPRRTEGRWLKFLFKEVLFLYFFNNLYIKIAGKSLGSWKDVR